MRERRRWLERERQLLRLRGRPEPDAAAVADAELLRQARHLGPHGLRLGGREVGPVAVEALVPVELLGPLAGELLEEVLAGPRPEEEDVRPDAARTGLAGCTDDLGELLGPVRD